MDEILKDKLFCEDVIKKSYLNNKKIAERIGAKYKEFAVKYHPDRKKNYQYPNPPYIKQFWHLAVGAKEVYMVLGPQIYRRILRLQFSSQLIVWF
jgi:hypothetical protein